ncbi:unnamed protein product [Strongylus vulgaris]|uniref:Uncharacterized protein n=1 Tax=Strongylus vulgaris TaxID=40348 RepID=A0A3P7J5T6_STRVU|nr:unnamed protein product [Strongylus vulgaris]
MHYGKDFLLKNAYLLLCRICSAIHVSTPMLATIERSLGRKYSDFFGQDPSIIRLFLCKIQKGFALSVSLLVLAINFYFLYAWVDEHLGLTLLSVSLTLLLALAYITFILFLVSNCFTKLLCNQMPSYS